MIMKENLKNGSRFPLFVRFSLYKEITAQVAATQQH